MPEVLWTICAILGVLVLAYLFTRYVAGRGLGGGTSRLGKRMLTILDQVAVGKDQRLLLVRDHPVDPAALRSCDDDLLYQVHYLLLLSALGHGAATEST